MSQSVIFTSDMHSDHDGLVWKCPFHLLHMLPPPPRIDTYTDDESRKLKTPMSAADTQHLKHALQTLESQLATFNAKVQSHLISLEDPSHETIHSFNPTIEELTTILVQRKNAWETCTTVPKHMVALCNHTLGLAHAKPKLPSATPKTPKSTSGNGWRLQMTLRNKPF
jgi:hypothetical protein